MKAFQFPLQKALDWRRTQLEMAESRVRQQAAAIAAIDRARAELDAAAQRSEIAVRHLPAIAGLDLGALGTYRLAATARSRDLARRRAECQQEMAHRQAALLESRRRCRLLERLKDRRLSEWQADAVRELDELAADSYLAQWARRHAMSI